ncbi:MAG: deoxyguanosinetriphosphate triphosphohydrolase [Candidatus Omnitrophota bacterium]
MNLVKNASNPEEKLLAKYAVRSFNSRGRTHKEKEHTYRLPYQRDRDRIIHSAAFRRLEYKTQVFVNHEGDYYRTRLTHTLEVSQIARTIGRALKLNTDLIEAIALAHDLGHTPFGHAGEEALNELMAGFGGFNHNAQGLRVVDLLENRYPEFPGLNLSWEVREGIIKHSTSYDFKVNMSEFDPDEMPYLETQVVDIADEIAYDNHDLDDGLTAGLITNEDLKRVPVWDKINKNLIKKYPTIVKEKLRYQTIKSLIDLQVTDLIENSLKILADYNLKSQDDIRRTKQKLIRFSKKIEKERTPLRQFLFDNLYHNFRVMRMANKAKRFISDLFNTYFTNPESVPFYNEIKNKNNAMKKRAICDHIAAMTDRFALDEYKKLFDPYKKV